MEKNDTILIEEIIKNGRKEKMSFRGDDLFKTWLEANDYEIPTYVQDFNDENIQNRSIHTNFKLFKVELLASLDRHRIPYIASYDDSLDIYPDIKEKNDEIRIDELRFEDDKLDEQIYEIEKSCNFSYNKTIKEKIAFLYQRQFDIFDEIRAIRSKWKKIEK